MSRGEKMAQGYLEI